LDMPKSALFNRTQYSILEAATPIKDLAQRAVELGYQAIGLADRGNLFGLVDFYKACKERDLKPVIGAELFVAPGPRQEKRKLPGMRAAYPLLLYAMDQTGYRNLCALSSKGYLEGFYYVPRVDQELLREHSEGLIACTGSIEGRLAQTILYGSEADVEAEMRFLKEAFPNRLYLQLTRNPMTEEQIEQDGMATEPWLLQQYYDAQERQERVNQRIIQLASEHALPMVATHEVLYLEREGWRGHEVLLNILSGEAVEIWERDSTGQPVQRILNPKRETRPSHAYHLLSAEQMEQLFHDVPAALAGSNELAQRCNVQIDFKTKHYPVFVPPQLEGKAFTEEDRKSAAADYLRNLCAEKIPVKYTHEKLLFLQDKFQTEEPLRLVQERLAFELDLILAKELGDYLLIVFDIIDWAKRHGIPVGPGRGSGAGSIICYLLGITEIEPLRFDLFFERFINPERLSYPDIDVDICMDRRGEVIQYVVNRYGHRNVAQIITFGTIKAKMAIKDVGRVLSVPLSKVNHIAKLIPEDPTITLTKALETDPDLRQLYEQDLETQQIIDLGQQIEGSIRNTGVHAAGLIIAGGPTTDYIPICSAKDSDLPVTQFAMKPVESVGMLKMDLLGLKTLTSIQLACQSIEKAMGQRIDWHNLPLDDPKTFHLLNQGRTLGVFQLESGGMQDLARQRHLERFEEIIAVLSLYRPGPMEMIPSFIRRKHGKEPIDYDHPEMVPILKETYGIMVYQEQVMQIAQKLAHYSLGEGDVLRRAMGKKDKEEMARQRQKFISGAAGRGCDSELAGRIFDKMERFAAYGFNKSHAAAYSMVCYVTAFLKANYPGHWLAALMTCDRDDVSKLAKFIREAQAMQIQVLPPDVNESEQTFVATASGIRFALSGIKGVGSAVVDAILDERQKGGPYRSLRNCLERVDLQRCNKKSFELLIDAGGFDFTGWSRDALRIACEEQFDRAQKQQKDKRAGILDLFGGLASSSDTQQQTPPPVSQPTSQLQRWFREKELLGLFLTGHPMDHYRPILQRLSCAALSDLETLSHNTVVRSAFIIESFETKISAKSGKKFAILRISDGMESFELPIWPELYEQSSLLLGENRLCYAILQVERPDGDAVKLQCKWLADLTQADEQMVHACDRAFDKAKQGVRMQEFRAQNTRTPNAVPAAAPAQQPLRVSIRAGSARLSQLLQLKSILRAHQGSHPVEIDFLLGGQLTGRIRLGANRGIQLSEALLTALRQIESVSECRTIES
jgi:DNA polymerase-3 subunit alpha